MVLAWGGAYGWGGGAGAADGDCLVKVLAWGAAYPCDGGAAGGMGRTVMRWSVLGSILCSPRIAGYGALVLARPAGFA